ncbi:MAG: O-succinylhomoserine (thiol)-lyase [Rheinheimera sp.]|uniref:cystathionine gamma-synthase n=1 Tax=Arsukibacterium sp. UBA3155 TaxID=1946058 RepID=UPI000C8D59F2|nr:cystathionine gamma-synthase [Arsukibacterium sp. UBA3155]MAD76279.1 O-succinylhomoserine (thiol)-lyase [Rheinheimera sp.]|tara:strand:+ start:31572 stop:32846 length:1275 start_codon:yes stop_codon:yes gene_type:complete
MSHSAAATITARAGIAEDTAFGAVTPPLYLTTTYELPALGQPGQYDYSRSNNPTRDTLAEALCELEQGARAIVTGSGMSACLLALQLLGPEDTLVIPHDCYGGSYRLFTNLAQRKQAFKLVIVNFQQTDWAKQLVAAKPAMIWLETPSNPLLQITDVKAVCQLASSIKAKVVVDNTFLSPVLQQPLQLGADIVVHSTTKYINGHSDIVGGVLVAKDPAVGDELKWWANCLGVTGPAFDSYMTLRGLRTLVPRLQLQQQNTAELVSFLQRQPLIGKLYYPGLVEHPGHAIAKAQQSGFGAMCSFDLAAPADALPVFFSSLSLFTLAQSLGGIESLICHPSTMTHASMDAAAQQTAGIGPTLVRLSVGIEAPADLIADLQSGFNAVANWLGTQQSRHHSKQAAAKVQGKSELNRQYRLNPALTALW